MTDLRSGGPPLSAGLAPPADNPRRPGCENRDVSSVETARFRHSQAIWVAAIIAFIGALPIAGVGWYFAPVLLIPLAVAVWAWRAGTDADPRGVRVRALLGQRRIDWSEIIELAPDDQGRIVALLSNGQVARLPAVHTADLPQLVAASGQHVVDEAAQ